MSASGSCGMLTLATRNLMARWEETRISWRDQKALEFEVEYLGELSEKVAMALSAMEELNRLLERIHADCE